MDLGAHGARHLAVNQTVRVPGRAAHLAQCVVRQQLRTRQVSQAGVARLVCGAGCSELCGDASLACCAFL